MKGIGGHQSAAMLKDEWLTPPEIISALGVFDLDPCSPIDRPWDTAKKHYTIKDNGLMQPWIGRIWLNPPYGNYTKLWMYRLVQHGNGIALIFARTETEFFQRVVFQEANAIFFIKGRLYFHHVDGTKAAHNSGAPSVLVAYGENNIDCLRENNSGIGGTLIRLK